MVVGGGRGVCWVEETARAEVTGGGRPVGAVGYRGGGGEMGLMGRLAVSRVSRRDGYRQRIGGRTDIGGLEVTVVFFVVIRVIVWM